MKTKSPLRLLKPQITVPKTQEKCFQKGDGIIRLKRANNTPVIIVFHLTFQLHFYKLTHFHHCSADMSTF